MQQITLKHFLPALGIPAPLVQYHKPIVDIPHIGMEFDIGYRFGHDMIPDIIDTRGATGHTFATVTLFNGQRFYGVESAAGPRDHHAANNDLDNLLATVAAARANEIDGKMSSALRDTLFGDFGEDLSSRNVFRGRDVGLPGYGEIAMCYDVKPRAEARSLCDQTGF